MDIMVIVYAILAYLIGSIPSGLIIGKTFFNTDVRQYGSKNIGATNTYRVIGLKAALPVFLCDALKGAAGVVLLSSYGPMYMILGGILAMMGHNWSILKAAGGIRSISDMKAYIAEGCSRIGASAAVELLKDHLDEEV